MNARVLESEGAIMQKLSKDESHPLEDLNFSQQQQQSTARTGPIGSASSSYYAPSDTSGPTLRSSPAASLIQSAARSILDDATSPSSVVSENGSTSTFSSDFYRSKRPPRRNINSPSHTSKYRGSPLRSPQLTSLQVETMPALPDEQDRKRFVGCLAAILASAYDYDEPEDDVVPEDPVYDAYLDEVDGSQENGTERHFRVELASRERGTLKNSASASFDYSDVDEIRSSSTVSSPSMEERRSKRQSTSIWRSSVKEKALRALERHRKRRYDVLSRLLLQSAELLLLEPSASKAFMPMLSKVLYPQKKRPSASVSQASSSTRPPLYNAPKTSPPRIGTKSPQESPQRLTSPPSSNTRRLELPPELDADDILRPFLECLTPGAGFRCLSLFLLQHLLTSESGYDARIRRVIKKLGVIVLAHDMILDPVEDETIAATKSYDMLVARATRKFESLENSVARRIIRLSESENKRAKNSRNGKGSSVNGEGEEKSEKGGITREQFIRGVKIGSAGIVAGTLFAVTGGIAAPGIAAGMAALAGGSAAVAALTSTVVVTTIFGVGGGGLAAYKMQRRTQGLTEFEIRKEERASRTSNEDTKPILEAELFRTICISGWIRDDYDFQRPWGVHPTNPPLHDRTELLERFYSVHSPDHVPKVSKILTCWKNEEDELWKVLEQKYGCDPDHLFPLDKGPREKWGLTLEQEEVLDALFVELGYNSAAPKKPNDAIHKVSNPLERMRSGWKNRRKTDGASKAVDVDSTHGPTGDIVDVSNLSITEASSNVSGWESVSSADLDKDQEQVPKYNPPKHLATVWDFRSTYAGELYTIRWESELITKICDYVRELAMDVVSGATKQLLKQTVLATLLTAVTWPSYLVNVANMIDGEWTLAVERADEAGKELARTLLFSRAGHRPATLVGYSFGARIIYSCLKEMAKFQEDWEDFQELSRLQKPSSTEKQRRAKMAEKFEGIREPASVIEDVVMMGIPNHLNMISWKACRQVVSGRLINCYSQKDLILSLMFQVKRISAGNLGEAGVLKPVCGTCPIKIPGVENYDVSDLISGHQEYCLMTGQILDRVGLGQPLRLEELSVAGD